MTQQSEPYILIAQQDWYADLGSNARNMAMEISKTNKVLYVNPPLDVNTIVKHGGKKQVRNRLKAAFGNNKTADRVAGNIWVHTPSTIFLSINWLPNDGLFNVANRTNSLTFFNSIKKALKSLSWHASDCTVINDSQMFVGVHVNRFLKPRNNFYYIRDNLIHHPYFVKHGSRIEPETIKGANAVFANSAYLAGYAQQYNPLSYDIGQGCELDMYNPDLNHSEPSDLKELPHPRIGYTGFLTGERLDISLLEKLASLKENWHWILIGPEEIMFQQSRLHQLKNVHFLGAKKVTELPSYLAHLDVCINPQLVNELTVGNYPRKIDEYLAMGKPVVATDTPAMQMFVPHVLLANSPETYIESIEYALKKNPAGKQDAAISFAKSHTWENCINKIFTKQNEIAT